MTDLNEIVTMQRFQEITNMSKAQIYALTTQRKLPFYKPTGKLIFFRREDVLNFIFTNRIKTQDEIVQEALNQKSVA